MWALRCGYIKIKSHALIALSWLEISKADASPWVLEVVHKGQSWYVQL